MIFLDTWAYLAIANRHDEHHGDASDYLRSLQSSKQRLCTTDYVLDETITGLYRAIDPTAAQPAVDAILESVTRSEVALIHITPDRFNRAVALRRQLSDKPYISFTDLTSVVVMHELGLTEVFSGDADFRQLGLVLVPH